MSADPTVDLNADVGEGFDDEGVAPFVSSLNIACGGHAGDERTMRTALALARDHGLAAGAHPGYPDRERFGRVETGVPAEAIAASLSHQVERLAELAREGGLRLAHVKPHGALYHRATSDPEAARAIAAAVAALDPGLALVGFPGSHLLAAAAAAGLDAVPEGFVDRRYGRDGRLVPRAEPGALLAGEEAASQAVALARAGGCTLCLHSDSPGAAALARTVRRALEAEGFAVAPFAPKERVSRAPVLRVVGAAIVEAGKVLLTRRAPGMSMAGKWEFPGGKVEPGESEPAALAREVAEELGLAIEVGARLGRGSSWHDGRRIELIVYLARRRAGDLQLAEHEEHGWFDAAGVGGLDWPEADLPVLPALQRALAGVS